MDKMLLLESIRVLRISIHSQSLAPTRYTYLERLFDFVDSSSSSSSTAWSFSSIFLERKNVNVYTYSVFPRSDSQVCDSSESKWTKAWNGFLLKAVIEQEVNRRILVAPIICSHLKNIPTFCTDDSKTYWYKDDISHRGYSFSPTSHRSLISPL